MSKAMPAPYKRLTAKSRVERAMVGYEALEQQNAELKKQVKLRDAALKGICDLITGHKKTSYYILNDCMDMAKAATRAEVTTS